MSGVLLYVNHDYKFSVQAYLWIGVWYVVSIFELIYVKHLVTTSNMTTWGRARDSLSFPFYSPPIPHSSLFNHLVCTANVVSTLPAAAPKENGKYALLVLTLHPREERMTYDE